MGKRSLPFVFLKYIIGWFIVVFVIHFLEKKADLLDDRTELIIILILSILYIGLFIYGYYKKYNKYLEDGKR